MSPHNYKIFSGCLFLKMNPSGKQTNKTSLDVPIHRDCLFQLDVNDIFLTSLATAKSQYFVFL